MDILRKYLLSNVYRAAEDGAGAAEPPIADNPLAADAPAGDPAAAPAAPEPDAAAADAADASAADAAADGGRSHGNKGQTPWYMKRINEETNAKQAALAREQAAEFKARSLEEMLARLQRSDTVPVTEQTRKAAPDIAAPQQYEADVRRAAAELTLNESRQDIIRAGYDSFGAPAFDEAANILHAVGATSNDFILDILAVDKANAHVLIDKLAKDPERTATLAGMDSRRRVAELLRMNMTDKPVPVAAAPAAPARAPVAVSKAPAPKPVMAAAAAPSAPADPYDDKASDQDFSAAWDQKFKKRA